MTVTFKNLYPLRLSLSITIHLDIDASGECGKIVRSEWVSKLSHQGRGSWATDLPMPVSHWQGINSMGLSDCQTESYSTEPTWGHGKGSCRAQLQLHLSQHFTSSLTFAFWPRCHTLVALLRLPKIVHSSKTTATPPSPWTFPDLCPSQWSSENLRDLSSKPIICWKKT
jgi:hypothetical protein